MATLKKWSAFTNRANLSDNDNAQVMILDTTAAAASRNQRTPVTQIMRSGKNLSDLGNVSTAVTNLGATTTNTANALARRDTVGAFSMGILTANGGSFSAGVSSFNITGVNAACNVGTNFNVAQSSGSGSFFAGTVSGDCILRQTNSSFSICLGIGSDAPELQILLNSILVRANISNISAANPASLLESSSLSSTGTFGQVTSANTFFNGTAVGDIVLKNSDTAVSLRLGLGTGNSQLQIVNANVNFHVDPKILSATNPALYIGTQANIGEPTSNGQFFSNSLTGDTVIKNTNTSNTVRIGVGSSSSQFDVTNTQLISNVPFVCAGNGTFSGGTVSCAAVSTGAINATLLTMDDTNITQATSGGQFFTDVLTGDTVIANTDSAKAIRLGVGSSTDARLVIDTSTILSTANLLQTNGSLSVGADLTVTETIFATGDIHVGPGGAQASAVVIVDSTTQGFLPPRMTTTQKNAISSPASGLIVYDSTLGKLCVRGAAAWETITSI